MNPPNKTNKPEEIKPGKSTKRTKNNCFRCFSIPSWPSAQHMGNGKRQPHRRLNRSCFVAMWTPLNDECHFSFPSDGVCCSLPTKTAPHCHRPYAFVKSEVLLSNHPKQTFCTSRHRSISCTGQRQSLVLIFKSHCRTS